MIAAIEDVILEREARGSNEHIEATARETRGSNDDIEGTPSVNRGSNEDSEATTSETRGSNQDSEATTSETRDSKKDSEATTNETRGSNEDSEATTNETRGSNEDIEATTNEACINEENNASDATTTSEACIDSVAIRTSESKNSENSNPNGEKTRIECNTDGKGDASVNTEVSETKFDCDIPQGKCVLLNFSTKCPVYPVQQIPYRFCMIGQVILCTISLEGFYCFFNKIKKKIQNSMFEIFN